MIYFWLKAAHIVAVIIWVGGMLAAPPVAIAISRNKHDVALRTSLKQTFSRSVTPAMVAALVLGVWLAVTGGWFEDGWLAAKLALVLVMTALHGVISGNLRRFAMKGSEPLPNWFGWLPVITLALLAAITLLVLRKAIF